MAVTAAIAIGGVAPTGATATQRSTDAPSSAPRADDDVTAVNLPTSALDVPTRPSSDETVKPTDAAIRRAAKSPQECAQPVVTDGVDKNLPFDVLEHELSGNCSSWTLTTRLRKQPDLDTLGAWVMEIDVGKTGHGCNGTDSIVIATVENGRFRGSVYAVPTCDGATWTTLGPATVRRPNRTTIAVTFDGYLIGPGNTFRWWAGVDRTGDGGFDAAPNKGWATARIALPAPRGLRMEIQQTPGNYSVRWDDPLFGATKHTATLRRNGGTPVDVPIDSAYPNGLKLENLTHGRYTLSVMALNGRMQSRPATTRFTIHPPVSLRPDTGGRVSAPVSGEPRSSHVATPGESSEPVGSTARATGAEASESSTEPTDLRVTTAELRLPTSCNQRTAHDGSGDGTIDITSVAITSDCRKVRFVITARQPFQDWQLKRLGISFGEVDQSPKSSCDGMTRLFLIQPSGGVLAGTFHFLNGCTYSTGSPMPIERLSSTTLAVTIGRGYLGTLSSNFEGFRWQVFAEAAAGGEVDAAPNLPTAAWDGAPTPRVEAQSSDDGRTLDVTWGYGIPRARSFEVRHREVGGTWSRVTRVPHNRFDLSITGLTPGKRYEVSLTALSTVGHEAPRVVTVRHLGRPGVITFTGVAMVAGRLTITYALPSDRGGSKTVAGQFIGVTDTGQEVSFSPAGPKAIDTSSTSGLPITVYAYAIGSGADSDVTALRITELPQ